MKLDDGNVKEVVSNKVEDNKPEAKEEQGNIINIFNFNFNFIFFHFFNIHYFFI